MHQRDNKKLISTLKRLRDLGNSVIVVEHDEEMMMESDYIIDIGLGAGVNGGVVVAKGRPKEIQKNKKVWLENIYRKFKISFPKKNICQKNILKS